jgi:maltose alpha-D-glucosyltransferase/alpha-amylase
MVSGRDWFRDAVVYEIDVKTFNDANGDGIGDIEGVIDRLDYLDRLGVSCLWLLPVFPSPWRDNGYDVADYYGIHSKLGSLGDFRDLLDAAHDRGMRVLVDMVFNHTSTDHEWFQRAREDPNSPYRDYYLWTDDPDDAPDRENIFPTEEDGVWTYDEEAQAYYYHQFYAHQPDLNVANPAVRAELRQVLAFWTDLGVDGFRIDAATPMITPKGAGPVTIDEPHELFKEMKTTVRKHSDDAILLAEADDEPAELRKYVGTAGDEFDLLLSFVMNAHLVYALATGEADYVERGFDLLPDHAEIVPHGQWANFLRNFDELNLAALQDEELFEAAMEHIGDADARIFDRGVRLRIADILDGERDRLACAQSLLFALPGTPIVVAGDELGMGADLSLAGRDAVRTPMQWDDSENAGFSRADSADLYRRVVDSGRFSYDRINAEDQLTDPESLLNVVSDLAAIRRTCPELGRGEHAVLDTDAPGVFANRSSVGDATLLTVHNIGETAAEVVIDISALPGADTGELTRLYGDAVATLDDGTLRVDCPAAGFCWARLGVPRHRTT